MNITELAKEANVSRPYLSQIESGDRTPSPDILRKLSRPLGVSHEHLMYKASYISEKSNQVEELERQNRILREGLQFYADPSKYGDRGEYWGIVIDSGETAREHLRRADDEVDRV